MENSGGERIAEIRKALGLTQKELAIKIRVSWNYVSALEQGQKPLNTRIIKLIADTFNVNESWLETGNGQMFNDIADTELAEITSLFSQLHPKLRSLVIEQLGVLLEINEEANRG
ncbi:MAG: helix-turn-helix domain-containing protein [Spirochaetaceae bacterium]|jgi:transcriptional regulator with XRE-family HTH domain|nr:helix-turn-helix domain-containing protein [Spirochaetaceae bacterium]